MKIGNGALGIERQAFSYSPRPRVPASPHSPLITEWGDRHQTRNYNLLRRVR